MNKIDTDHNSYRHKHCLSLIKNPSLRYGINYRFSLITEYSRLARTNKECHGIFTNPESVLSQYKDYKWEKALKYTKPFNPLNMIRNGYIPKNINREIFYINDFGDTFHTPLELILYDNSKNDDIEKFMITDHLISKGAILPVVPRLDSEDLINCKNHEQFFLYVRNHPEFGNKMLHELYLNPSFFKDEGCTLKIILSNPKLDFTILDIKGDTPLHSVGKIANEKIDPIINNIFREYIYEAAKRDFDFATPGEYGLTVLHHAATVKSKTILKLILEHSKILTKESLDKQCDKNFTALYYAVIYKNIISANALLDKGASPVLGSISPLKAIDDVIYSLTVGNDIGIYFQNTSLKKFKQLKSRMKKIAKGEKIKPMSKSKKS